MVVRNKLHRALDAFRKYLDYKQAKNGNAQTLKGKKTKNAILDFYIRKGRWPSRNSKLKTERKLAARFENYVSKEAASYDSKFRQLVFASGLRNTNNKRNHDVDGFKKQIIDFIDEHGRVPSVNESSFTVEGETLLRSRLDYYTQEANDMTFLGKVYAGDPCHKSGIPGKYRSIINEALVVKKPLIRLV